jgi:two-component system, NtrC family, nitrogen regulation response regulator NtrX
MPDKILLIEDTAHIAEFFARVLQGKQYIVKTVKDSREFFACFAEFDPDVILADIALENSPVNGVEIIREAKKTRNFHARFIGLSSMGTRKEVAELMELGAYTFHDKKDGFDLEKLLIDIRHAIEDQRKDEALREQREKELSKWTLVGDSPAMQEVRRLVSLFAPTDRHVLITGETGAGKEVVAQQLFWNSPRKERKLLTINCAAIVTETAYSELFGHKKGAYTGAISEKEGYFLSANKGALFLDEIGNLNLDIQAGILLAVGEYPKVQVLGGEPVPVDARCIFATNRDIQGMVKAGAFREDLYSRISKLHIHLPPLRERGEDLLLLCERFLGLYIQPQRLKVDIKDLAPVLMSYSWPRNVRELKDFCDLVAILHPDEPITNRLLQHELERYTKKADPAADSALQGILDLPTYREATDAFERLYLETALRRHQGNVSAMTESVGIDRTCYYKKMKVPGKGEE